jgi:hypothetical protein
MAGRISNPLHVEAPHDAWWHYRAAMVLKDISPDLSKTYLQAALDDSAADDTIRKQAARELAGKREPAARFYGPDDPLPF